MTPVAVSSCLGRFGDWFCFDRVPAVGTTVVFLSFVKHVLAVRRRVARPSAGVLFAVLVQSTGTVLV